MDANVFEERKNEQEKPRKKQKTAIIRSIKPKKTKQLERKSEKMHDKLSGAQFRWLNEQLYTVESSKAQALFNSDESYFQAVSNAIRKTYLYSTMMDFGHR